MICKICGSIAQHAFTSKILKKYDVKYFNCINCDYLFSEEPFWLDEAYSRPINLSDTGLLNRNIYFSKILSVLIYFNFNKKAKYLDYAGGYGLLTRLMRDIGFDFYWHDPYTQNLFANGFEDDFDTNPKYEVLTAFEVFEHLKNPNEELEKMLLLSDNIIFSTELMKEQIPNPKEWWYYGFNHGQHISFFSKKSLIKLAQIFNLNYFSIGGLHLLTKVKLKSFRIYQTRLYNFGLAHWVSKKMVSKTQSDFEIIKNIEF